VRAERLVRSPNIAEKHAFPQASTEKLHSADSHHS
jgi:hypothetical protein